MAEGYLVRWFRESDLEDYIAGLNVNLYDEYDEARFRWKFRENPFSLGFPSIAVVEEEATGKPVAFNSFLPLKIRSGDEFFTAVQGCDGFVDPGHRRRGLFQRTLEFMSENIAGLGPDILMGFNFGESAAAAVKSGSVLVDDVFRWTVDPRNLEGNTHAIDEKTKVSQVPCGLEAIHSIYRKWAEKTGSLHVYRAIDYLRWRFEINPLTRYTFHLIGAAGSPLGYIVSSIGRDEEEGPTKMKISDYIIVDSDVDTLSAALLQLAERYSDEVDVFEALSLDDGLLARSSEELGFQREAEPFSSLIMKPIRSTEIKDGKLIRRGRDISRSDLWYLTPSDIF